MAQQTSPPSLQRTLGFWALAIYGIGDILGAGIYALVGKVAGEAGLWSPISFLVAMTVAGLTGLTYAELVTRYPRSGGEATFCLEAFGRPRFAFVVGWLVFCSGVVSMAAVSHAFANYAHGFWPDLVKWPVWLTFLIAIALLNFVGMRQSSWANIVFTAVEACGLLLVLVVGFWFLSRHGIPQPVADQESSFRGLGVLSAAGLAFFAYIGFEDMINVAEEVRAPERHYPKAIILAVAFCGLVYVAICSVALAIVPAAELGAADAPLLEVVRRAAPAVPPMLFTVIALIAVANTGLLNCIMASRLVYGMARQRLLPKSLAAVHRRTRTPHWAVLIILVTGIALAASGSLTVLAETTSLLLLVVFGSVNAAAIRMRLANASSGDGFRVPLAIPVLAIITCIGLSFFTSKQSLLTAGVVLLVGLILMFLCRSEAIAAASIDE